MSIDHHLYMDTTASRHDLRDVLIRAGLGLEAEPDGIDGGTGGPCSGAFNKATLVSIHDNLLPIFRSRPGAGVTPTRSIGFNYRKTDLERFERDITLSIAALLRAYPEADAFWEGMGDAPMLLRRHGRLVLSEAQTGPRQFWNAQDQPYRGLFDLPYVVGPLGPW